MDLFQKMNQRMADKLQIPAAEDCLPGRADAIATAPKHHVLETDLKPPFAPQLQTAIVGMGCFWGAEKRFWSVPGVAVTAVGYCGGITPNPTYEEVCSGKTGHNEVVLIAFDPAVLSLEALFALFWESHNPTQGMRQGNDVGTQYRSGIYLTDAAQMEPAQARKQRYQQQLSAAGEGDITTEICMAGEFYYAEAYHQQYLSKNPNGYCGLGGTGVCY